MGLKVWASGPFSPVVICDDAATPDPDKKGYPEGTASGQFGWDVGIKFSSTVNLAEQLAKVVAQKNAKIERLAIDVHGDAGYIDIDGKIGVGALANTGGMTAEQSDKNLKSKAFGMEMFDAFAPAFRRVADTMTSDGVLLFMSCNFGAMPIGSAILKKMSKELFPGRKIVAFITIGISPGVITVNHCMLPGMKATDSTRPSWSKEEEYRRQLLVKGDPWASETSPRAKIAQNGMISKNPEGISAQVGLSGGWSAKVGDRGPSFFVQIEVPGADAKGVPSTAGNLYWAEHKGMTRHYGEWKLSGDDFTFSFWDDPPNAKRQWSAKLNVQDGVFGSFIIKGVISVGGKQTTTFELEKLG